MPAAARRKSGRFSGRAGLLLLLLLHQTIDSPWTHTGKNKKKMSDNDPVACPADIIKAAMTKHRICTSSIVIKRDPDNPNEQLARLIIKHGFKCCYCKGDLDVDTLAIARPHDWETLTQKHGNVLMWGVCRTCHTSLRTKKPCPFKRYYSEIENGKPRLIVELYRNPPYHI